MKVPNLQDIFTYEDYVIATRARFTYNCGKSPIALIDIDAKWPSRGLRVGSEMCLQQRSLKLQYAIQVWNRVAIQSLDNPGKDGLLYYWLSQWVDNGTPFRELKYDQVTEEKLHTLKQLFWNKLAEVANSGDMEVCEGYHVESKLFDDNTDNIKFNGYVVLDPSLPEKRDWINWYDIEKFPYEKTKHTFCWEEIKDYFIELTPDQLRLSLPHHLSVRTAEDEALLRACTAKDFDKIKSALAQGANVNALDKFGETPLANLIDGFSFRDFEKIEEQEAYNKVLPMVDYLLEQGADIDLFGFDGINPLCEAYYAHSVQMVRHLLEKGANPNYNCHWEDGVIGGEFDTGETISSILVLALDDYGLGEDDEYDEAIIELVKSYGAHD